MGSAASCYDAQCLLYDNVDINDDGGNYGFRSTKYCRRTAYGVAVGILGCAMGIAIVAMRLTCVENDGSKIVFVVECASGFALLVLYSFAVAYLTGEEGPGAPLGNLYYSTWITFGLVLLVVASCLEEIRAAEDAVKGRVDPHWRQQSGGGTDNTSDVNVSSINLPVQSSMENILPISSDQREYNYHLEETGYESSFSSSKHIISIRSGSVGEVQVGM